MKLFLAVALLMLALVAYTDAQDEPLEERFQNFGEKLSAIGQTIAEKARSTFDDLHNSDAAVKTRTWFQERIEQLKGSFQ